MPSISQTTKSIEHQGRLVTSQMNRIVTHDQLSSVLKKRTTASAKEINDGSTSMCSRPDNFFDGCISIDDDNDHGNNNNDDDIQEIERQR
jgi:hypothetical protein